MIHAYNMLAMKERMMDDDDDDGDELDQDRWNLKLQRNPETRHS
jgi:hypothetical protein